MPLLLIVITMFCQVKFNNASLLKGQHRFLVQMLASDNESYFIFCKLRGDFISCRPVAVIMHMGTARTMEVTIMQRNVEKFGISDKRGRKRTSDDPYLPEGGLKEPAACQGCQAFYRQKRWHLDPEEAAKLRDDPGVQWVTCPACQKTAEHYPEGIVTLRGDYLWRHENEIRNILANEAERVLAKNPIARIMRMATEGESLVIETTEQKLAEHLGRSLNRAHHGELQINWSGPPRICRVNWERWQ